MSDEASASRASSAQSRDAVRTGGVISYRGDTLVTNGGTIVELVAARLRDRVTAGTGRGEDRLADGIPILRRGPVRIVPLFSAPSSPDVDERTRHTLDHRASDLGQQIMSACWYSYGDPLSVDLEAPARGGYAAELVRTGAREASWWADDTSALVLVHYGEPSPAPKTRMALHVVPLGWVSERRPTPTKKIPPLDLTWSWEDVVAFAQADATGNVAEQKTEGQGS